MTRPGRDPWTDPDPQPGDFDADLADIDPHLVETHPATLMKVTLIADADASEADPQ